MPLGDWLTNAQIFDGEGTMSCPIAVSTTCPKVITASWINIERAARRHQPNDGHQTFVINKRNGHRNSDRKGGEEERQNQTFTSKPAPAPR
jgi:hypothetical protein